MSIQYSKAQLKNLYNTKISQRLKILEKKRRELMFCSILSILSLSYLVLCFMVLKKYPRDLSQQVENFIQVPSRLVIPLITLSAFVLIYSYTQRKQFKQKFKKKIVKSIIKIILPEAKYLPEKGMSSHDYDKSELIKSSYNRYYSEDMIQMKYHNLNIEFSEVHTRYKSGGKKNSTRTIFRGFILKAQLPFSHAHNTIIVPDIVESFLGRTLGRFIQKNNIVRKEKLVQLEDIDFENKYAVYSSDQIEARKILTPRIMEKIVAYNHKAKRKISLSFIEGHLYMAIPTRHNYFEPKIWRPMKFGDVIKLSEMLEVITEIIDVLEFEERVAS